MSIDLRSEEHTSELQSPYVSSYAVFCLKKKRGRVITMRAHWLGVSPVLRRSAAIPSSCGLRAPSPSAPRPGTASFLFFFFNDTATTEIYTLSLHDALPI